MTVIADTRCFVDTNVLLCLFDDQEPARQSRSRQLIERLGRQRAGVVSTQVLLELFSALQLHFQVSSRTASLMTSAFCAWPVVDTDTALVLRAMARASEDQLPLWDAMIVEAALRAGATTLYSQDLQSERQYGSLRLVNPFA